ncbi:D-alanyl-D-alanine carboxypeptidase [Planomonospora parontospora subsp. parontospora]|uniref:D-alanyl-D-alanine carboxypeptidase n=3 Tax=Planomonospora parontospora TaxID=58119 RepID=A0AA37BDM7_9ACTN|nr:D-alanyl-D-alanine carboxypeptidase [Planomonospora parontospora]GII07272.1 D-alanyl-D-alanine carboxypeptidase [Planomonospora parontospora subsp. parontospora]
MGMKHVAPAGVLLATVTFLGAPAQAVQAAPPAQSVQAAPPGQARTVQAAPSAYGAPAGAWDPSGREPVGGVRLGERGIVFPTGMKAPPKTSAKSYVIADADTGEVLAAKNAHGRYLPASTLKALTALALIPKLDKAKKVRPSRNAVNVEGSAVGLVPKPLYTVEDLFKALLLVSGNDAAVALAEANGGLDRTLADMNAEARRLQAFDTVAKTPNGLDKPGQSSSAYDLALIARAGLANPDFRRYVSLKTDKFPAPKGYYEIGNHNKLLWRYKGMIGVKNGWTSKALASFVGAAKRNGHTVIVTIMRHDGYMWEDIADLLDWGFAARGRAVPVGRLVEPVPEPAPLPTAQAQAANPPAQGPAAAQEPAGAARPAEDSGSALPYAAAAAVLALLGGAAWLVYGRRRS